ncbi:MAG: Gp15 family bacteriophage protein [Treponema sp.]|uniref:Gp15 family bacteriophage protein n=1 Tax=Treponema sp. TaxID=166 RepID=UPI003FA2C69E
MIDLTKAKLPEAIELEGAFYRIHTDFRYFIRFGQLLKEQELKPHDCDFMFIQEIPPDRIAGMKALLAFMNPPHVLPRKNKREDTGAPALDYTLDADLIYAAFMQQYHIDLSSEPLHWYRFSALLAGLRDTKLNDVIGFRLWENTSGKRDEYTRAMQRLKDAWEIEVIDAEDDAALAEFEAQLQSAAKGKE